MARATVNGVELSYELRGERGAWIVLLNGIAMSIASWEPFAVPLESGYRLLLHDFKGQLLSAKPERGYSLRGHADDLAALMDMLGIERAHVVGTSYGGEVAVEFALAYAARTASLTVIDSATELDPLLEAAVESWKTAAAGDPVLFYRVIQPWNYSRTYLGANRAALAARERAVAAFPREWFDAFRSLCDAFLAVDQTPRLGAVACPALVMVGSEDLLKGRRFAELLVGGIPGAALAVIEGAGHAVVIEQPERTAKLLLEFLEAAGAK